MNIIESCYPKKGKYKLKIFAREQKEAGNYHIILEFYINVNNNPPKPIAGGFPSLFSAFTEKSCHLYSPKTGILRKGKSHSLKIRVPKAISVALIIDKKWTYLQRVEENGDIFAGDVDIGDSVNDNTACVYAKMVNNKNYDGLLKYQLE